jgi:hypothetical protein
MIEAMACGTPVIAYRSGSVPEVIEDGVTGFIVDNEEEAICAVGELSRLDRRKVRARFEARFSARRMADQYENQYRKLISAATGRAGTRLDARPSEVADGQVGGRITLPQLAGLTAAEVMPLGPSDPS